MFFLILKTSTNLDFISHLFSCMSHTWWIQFLVTHLNCMHKLQQASITFINFFCTSTTNHACMHACTHFLVHRFYLSDESSNTSYQLNSFNLSLSAAPLPDFPQTKPTVLLFTKLVLVELKAYSLNCGITFLLSFQLWSHLANNFFRWISRQLNW